MDNDWTRLYFQKQWIKEMEYLQCGATPQEAKREAQFEEDYQKYCEFLENWGDFEPDSGCGDCDNCNNPCEDLAMADNKE